MIGLMSYGYNFSLIILLEKKREKTIINIGLKYAEVHAYVN